MFLSTPRTTHDLLAESLDYTRLPKGAVYAAGTVDGMARLFFWVPNSSASQRAKLNRYEVDIAAARSVEQ